MTVAKQLKARIRTRMARTGERYAIARAHVVGTAGDGPETDAGWTLHGGTDPDTAALANVLAHRGVRGPAGPLTEPLLFLVGGGLGAGYILWEFAHDDSRVVTLGFTHSWQYFDRRLASTVDRLGLDVAWFRTGGSAGAPRRWRRPWPPATPRSSGPTAFRSATGTCRRSTGRTATRWSPTPSPTGGCTSTTARWPGSPSRLPILTGHGPGWAATRTRCSSSDPATRRFRPTGCAPRCGPG